MKVNAWIDALGKYSVDENGVEWNKLTLAEKEKAAKDAKEKFEKDKANWEISAKAVKGTATTVPTTDLKEVTDAYNSSYAAVESAVKAYNSAWDAVYQAAYDAAVVYWKTTPNNYSSYGGSFSMNGSAGLSTYIFRQSYEEEINPFYRQSIQWYSAAGWDETGW